MTALNEILLAEIERSGPMTIARFMSQALTHPEHGYYMQKDPFGVDGDFTTAPEISQMYGEMLGLWAGIVWQVMGKPEQVNLVECGPGRGTLMADALRALEVMPDFLEAVRVHLVEVSPELKAQQRKLIGQSGIMPGWVDSVDQLPAGPTIVLANEFLDALPVHQFEKTEAGWCERMVVADNDGGFQMALSQPFHEPTHIPPALRDSPVGAVFESCPEAQHAVATIAEHLKAQGGAALFVDYGHSESSVGVTLQAVKKHSFHDPMVEPGSADLTAHVDFAALEMLGKALNADVNGPVPQGAFLARLGMLQRAEMLAQNATEEQQTEIRAAAHRLTDPEEMGTLFKVMCISSPGLPVPPWAEV